MGHAFTHAGGNPTSTRSVHIVHLWARPVRSDGSMWLPANVAVDSQLRLRYAFDRVVTTLAVALENALDADLEVVRGYPLPPRHLRARLHLTF